jgi:gamma-glutamyltranspeptidase / glutathione hydrolase
LPDVISAESGGFSPEVAKALEAMGHEVDLPGDEASGGRGSSHRNELSAASDPRSPVGGAKVVAAPAAP